MMSIRTLRRTAPLVGLVALAFALNAPVARSKEGPGKGHDKQNCSDDCNANSPGNGKAKGRDKDRGKHVGRRAACTTDADCKADEFCHQDMKCHKQTPKPEICMTDAQCAAGETCRNGLCHKEHPCKEDADCNANERCADNRCTPSTPVTPPPAAPQEICGDCIDNDGNGLTDFEDPACCNAAQTITMALRNGKVIPRGTTSKLRLASILATDATRTVTPASQDLFIQIRGKSGDALCARIPSSRLDKKGHTFVYKAGKSPVASAQGLDRVAVKPMHNGSVKFKAKGHAAQVAGLHAGDLQLTVGFLDRASDAGNRCSSMMTAFRPAGRGMVAVR